MMKTSALCDKEANETGDSEGYLSGLLYPEFRVFMERKCSVCGGVERLKGYSWRSAALYPCGCGG